MPGKVSHFFLFLFTLVVREVLRRESVCKWKLRDGLNKTRQRRDRNRYCSALAGQNKGLHGGIPCLDIYWPFLDKEGGDSCEDWKAEERISEGLLLNGGGFLTRIRLVIRGGWETMDLLEFEMSSWKKNSLKIWLLFAKKMIKKKLKLIFKIKALVVVLFWIDIYFKYIIE